MYSKHGKTKLFTWFFALLSMLLIALFICLQDALMVDAESILGNFEDFFEFHFSEVFSYEGRNMNTLKDEGTYVSGVYRYIDNSEFSSRVTNIKQINIDDTVTIGQTVYDIKNDYKHFAIGTDTNDNLKLVLAPTDSSFYMLCKKVANSGIQGNYGLLCSERCLVATIDGNGNLQNWVLSQAKQDVTFRDGYTINQMPDSPQVIRNCSSLGVYQLVLSNCSVLSQEWTYDSDLENAAPFYNSIRLINNEYELYYAVSDEDKNNNGGPTIDNYCVMEQANWEFTVNEYNTKNIYPRGNVSFSFAPNDYQLDNLDKYNVEFAFSFNYSSKYRWKYNTDSPPFYKTSFITNNWKELNGYLVWYNPDDNKLYLDVPMSNFVANGNNKSFTWNELFDNLKGYFNNSQQTLTNVMRIGSEATDISYEDFTISCTARIVNSNDYYSGDYTETFNPINKQNATTDSSGKVNPNPYVEPDQNPTDEDSGTTPPSNDKTNTSTTTTGGSGVNINIVNNNTNNGGSGGSSGNGVTTPTSESEAGLFWNIFNPVKLFTNLLIDKNTSLGNEIVESFGINTYITVIASTFAFLPAAFWTSIVGYISSVFKILIVAFIIRIILDLL